MRCPAHTMAESDFSCPCIIGFGSSPSRCGPVGSAACGRTAAPSRQRPGMARRAVVLVIRLGQCRAGDHDSWRLRRAARELRGGRSSGADRARALQRLLRHGQYGASPAGARGSPWPPPRSDADRLTIGPPEDIATTIEALGAAELCNVYGLTETY